MFNFCQIKIVKNIYEELLEEIDSVKSEEKGNKLNSDELFRMLSYINVLSKDNLLTLISSKVVNQTGNEAEIELLLRNSTKEILV